MCGEVRLSFPTKRKPAGIDRGGGARPLKDIAEALGRSPRAAGLPSRFDPRGERSNGSLSPAGFSCRAFERSRMGAGWQRPWACVQAVNAPCLWDRLRFAIE
jgi:hypothetical protein